VDGNGESGRTPGLYYYAVGDDVTRAFINQFNNDNVRADIRPRMTASQFADALERGKARAAAASGGNGNFTEDRHKLSGMTHEEISAGIKKLQETLE
jgi:hypothetical protein